MVEHRTPTVLVVEDEALVALLIEGTLTEAGCHVEITENGKKALALAGKSPPDLLVMDMRLRGQPEGARLLRQLQIVAGPLPCVVVTGLYLTPEERRSLDLAGGGAPVPILQKPFDPDDLLAEVKSRLRPAAPPARRPLN